MSESEKSLIFSHIEGGVRMDVFRDSAGFKLFLGCEKLPEVSVSTFPVSHIVEILKRHGIWEGCLDQKALGDISDLLKSHAQLPPRRVGQGIAPTPGEDGRILWLARFYENPDSCTRPASRNRFFENIEKGREVAKLLPPRSGTSGKDVFGVEIPARSALPASLSIDTSLLKEPDEEAAGVEKVIANVSGYLEFIEPDKLKVRQTLVLNASVDERIGDILLHGNVHIVGSVMQGRSIECHGDLTIDESLQEGRVVCGGRLKVGHACVGTARVDFFQNLDGFGARLGRSSVAELYQVAAAGDSSVSVLQGLAARFSGNLIVGREIRECIVSVDGSLLMTSGCILGSMVHLGRGLEVHSLGADSRPTTVVSIGSNAADLTRLATIDQQLAQLEEARKLIHIHLGPLAHDTRALDKLSTAHGNKVRALLDKLSTVESSIGALSQERAHSLSNDFEEQVYQVNVLDSLHPEVFLQCRGTSFAVEKVEKGPFTLIFDGEGFHKQKYRKLQIE